VEAPSFAAEKRGEFHLSLRQAYDPAEKVAGNARKPAEKRGSDGLPALYTPQQRRRRDESVWTLIQGVLAPVQFLIFGVSLYLVIRFLATGEGEAAAEYSIFAKTMALYAIMITGSIWEKVVFGEWLFVKSFFWEDVFSMVVLALHTAYLLMLLNGWGSVHTQMYVALAAYATYVVNAGQFLWKLRIARLQSEPSMAAAA
jgi:3-vinyl bacteriochlorophyllide hydratase